MYTWGAAKLLAIVSDSYATSWKQKAFQGMQITSSRVANAEQAASCTLLLVSNILLSNPNRILSNCSRPFGWSRLCIGEKSSSIRTQVYILKWKTDPFRKMMHKCQLHIPKTCIEQNELLVKPYDGKNKKCHITWTMNLLYRDRVQHVILRIRGNLSSRSGIRKATICILIKTSYTMYNIQQARHINIQYKD